MTRFAILPYHFGPPCRNMDVLTQALVESCEPLKCGKRASVWTAAETYLAKVSHDCMCQSEKKAGVATVHSRCFYWDLSMAQGGASLTYLNDAQQSVLIVDPSAENREVLRTVLSRRGIRTWEARDMAQAVELHHLEHPAVTVIDVESVEERDLSDSNSASIDQLTATDTDPQNAFVFLGQMTRDTTQNVAHVMKKPYHFGPLIRTIEAMLQQHNTVDDID